MAPAPVAAVPRAKQATAALIAPFGMNCPELLEYIRQVWSNSAMARLGQVLGDMVTGWYCLRLTIAGEEYAMQCYTYANTTVGESLLLWRFDTCG